MEVEKTINDLNTEEARANLAYAEAALRVARLEMEADDLDAKVRDAKATEDAAYNAQRKAADAITAYYRRESAAREAVKTAGVAS